MEIGKNIKKIRLMKRMTQKAIEKKAGINREYLSKIENGDLKNPTIGMLVKIADGLDVSVAALLDDAGVEKVYEGLRAAFQEKAAQDAEEKKKRIDELSVLLSQAKGIIYKLRDFEKE